MRKIHKGLIERWVLTFAGVLATAGVVFALVVLVNAECGFVVCSGFSPYGWVIPLVAGVVLGSVVMLLLNQTDDSEEEGPEFHTTTCTACGGTILDEWRLCPHCGQVRDDDMETSAVTYLTATTRKS